MSYAIEVANLTKAFGDRVVLDGITFAIPTGAVVGLIGRNGSGKTTLLRHLVGLHHASAGTCLTLGRPSAALGPADMVQIGIVHQQSHFLGWMTVEAHLRNVARFYDGWDQALETRLLADLELDPSQRVNELSPADAQKIGVILAVCHHPRLLLLDEPMSALDAVARTRLFEHLLDAIREPTVVISSNVLRDVERLVDWIVCLDRGVLLACSSLADFVGRYREWVVRPSERLPPRLAEPFIVGVVRTAAAETRLRVRSADADREAFQTRHGIAVEERAVDLETAFALMVGEAAPAS